MFVYAGCLLHLPGIALRHLTYFFQPGPLTSRIWMANGLIHSHLTEILPLVMSGARNLDQAEFNPNPSRLFVLAVYVPD